MSRETRTEDSHLLFGQFPRAEVVLKRLTLLLYNRDFSERLKKPLGLSPFCKKNKYPPAMRVDIYF